MKKFIVTSICFCVGLVSFAASIDTFPFTPLPKWKTKIVFNDGTMLNGIATGSSDSTITMILPQADSLGNHRKVTIPLRDVKKIRMRDQNSLTLGENVLIGAGVGFLLGFLISVQDCNAPDADCSFVEHLFSTSRTQSAVKIGLGFSVLGLGLGLIGSDRVTFKFNLRKNKGKIKMPAL